MAIPKKIVSIWLGPPASDLVKRCLATHDLPGYEHVMITSDNYYQGSQYVNDAIMMGRYAKAVDFLRAHYLYELGGWYLDSDVEMLPGKNFDDLLDNRMVMSREKNNFVANAVIGSAPHHPLLAKYLETVDLNFKGTGDLVFAPGMMLFNESVWAAQPGEVTILTPDVLTPYDHQTNVMEQTEKTKCVHWFNKSWVV